MNKYTLQAINNLTKAAGKKKKKSLLKEWVQISGLQKPASTLAATAGSGNHTSINLFNALYTRYTCYIDDAIKAIITLLPTKPLVSFVVFLTS